ncbi:MAG: hypothetical protein M3Y19_02605, partial [Actinomycetota bacterium]|nr:hypothetical protein [Actinomycetota bacterium]
PHLVGTAWLWWCCPQRPVGRVRGSCSAPAGRRQEGITDRCVPGSVARGGGDHVFVQQSGGAVCSAEFAIE